MPYRLVKRGKGFVVVGPGGAKSRAPLPRWRAVKQMRALYAAMKREKRSG